jgi:hypothetical protein
VGRVLVLMVCVESFFLWSEGVQLGLKWGEKERTKVLRLGGDGDESR